MSMYHQLCPMPNTCRLSTATIQRLSTVPAGGRAVTLPPPPKKRIRAAVSGSPLDLKMRVKNKDIVVPFRRKETQKQERHSLAAESAWKTSWIEKLLCWPWLLQLLD